MDMTQIGTVVGITVICYIIGMACKAWERIPDKWIPVISGAAGAVLGVAGMYVIKDYPAQDVINAAAVGIASGLAATGANQIVKQVGKAQ